ncbi:A-kinase anchor protein 1, mitochondrial isoform X2 [Homalodisca vitripennis]|uniref:A-kinase anchor protein 1, mitochondrial isoform X2 n=1 Tax=Homalodisca vitripennis TaxID=197043 RepID=UPI001EE9C5D8|nr:A-kinase anchor protein 1, mitochondrial isoform X2 [Homalodisca vitripennis]
MVPCQPRQLVILSLPFAALVAFFWYKRRKSSSHSDPGGTPKVAALKPVDSSTVASPNVESKNVVCNGATFPITEEPEVVRVVCKDSENQPSSPENFEDCHVFHSTVIEDEDFNRTESEDEETVQDIVERDSSVEEEVIEKTLEHCGAQEIESIDQVQESLIEDKIVEEDRDQELEVPLAEQSTVENVALKAVTDVKLESISSEEKSSINQTVKSDLIVEDNLSAIIELSENKGDVSAETSVDTGLGSQELSTVEVEESDTTMALGQNTEEAKNAESATAGLERKLATLGLDTQTPVQRTERDSANHSPAEVMLNSPAISTFSDAHSEVERWLSRCKMTSGQMKGSSDSGKGCSDVVTPPSRTPAGGSSVAGDQVPIIYEFVLPQVIVGRLIGRHGAFLHDIRSKTHTNVFIKRHPETNTLKICAIEGTQPDIDAALKMIRQKFPLRRFPELTLEKVTFVKNSCLPINPENLQLHLVEGVNNDVLLSSLITAGHFFLQMPMHISYQSLYRLACIMNNVYNTQESPPLPDPQPDVVCVAPAHGGWYRAQILSVDEEAHTSHIKFLDYGGFLTVENSSLRQIRGDFLLLPFQAVECVLANVVPAGGGEEWSDEATQFVQLITGQQTLQAQVYEYTESGMPLIYLYCTQFYQSPSDPSGYETQVVLLNQELVSRGYAELIVDTSLLVPNTV